MGLLYNTARMEYKKISVRISVELSPMESYNAEVSRFFGEKFENCGKVLLYLQKVRQQNYQSRFADSEW